MASNIKYPIGIQDFEGLRKDGYLYVDKTAIIRRLIEDGKYYFLSRPRRFGKSLLLSTIAAYFEGKRELFQGLAIDTDEVSWEAHPILHLDLNTEKYDTKDALEQKLESFIAECESVYGKRMSVNSLGIRFENVIRQACEKTGKRVVILIDEYDKPMLQAIGNPTLQDEYRSTLKAFYGALKSMDGCIKFAFLTGVTKFGKVNVFSDLNHLTDVSDDPNFASCCGFTKNELLAIGISDQAVPNITKECGGYIFGESTNPYYNSGLIMAGAARCDFRSDFTAVTPSFLFDLIRKTPPVLYSEALVGGNKYNEALVEAGFVQPNGDGYDFVNHAMCRFYCVQLLNQSWIISHNFRELIQDVEHGRTEQFIKRLRSFFADTPGVHPEHSRRELVKDLENHYQNVLFIISRLMGFYTKAEYHTSEGRIDMVIQTPLYCYILEFKLDGTAEEALQQIQDTHYTLPFEMNGQQIIRIGINLPKVSREL